MIWAGIVARVWATGMSHRRDDLVERPLPAASDSTDRGRLRSAGGPNFVSVWLIVSGLWIVATGLRIHRVWMPMVGWPTVLSSVFTWASLLLPPLMFAIVLLAVKRIAAPRHRPDG